MKPVRLQRRRIKGWRLVSPGGLRVISCSRPGLFGNPFTGPGAVEAYRKYLSPMMHHHSHKLGNGLGMAYIPPWHHAGDVIESLPKIVGCHLMCYCKLCPRHAKDGKPLDEDCPECAPCHVDVLAEFLRALANHAVKQGD